MPRREALRLLGRAARGVVTGAPVRPPAAASRGRPGGAAAGAVVRADPTAPAPGVLRADALAGLAVAAPEAGPPLVLGYYPTVTTNPVQVLLYDHALDAGIVPVPLRVEAQLDELEGLQRAGHRTALHLHWLHPVLRGAASIAAAQAQAERFLARIDRYLATGGQLVWTVHNVLPHEARYPAEEAKLCAAIVQRAAVIHILTEHTPAQVASHYTLPPDRLLHVPHPSYTGAYPDHVSRREARQRLQIGPDELVVLAMGSIRPYKGLDALLGAWTEIGPGAWRLLIAGPTTDEPGVTAIVQRAQRTPRVVVDARKIPAVDVQIFLRAADVAVFPYVEALNSGALVLALTFGLPVIVPAGSALAEDLDPAWGRAYDPVPPTGLADALRTARELATPEARVAAAGALAGREPATISRRLADGLRARLIGPG